MCLSLCVYRVALYAGLAFVRATGTLIRMNGIILYQLNLPLSSSLLTIALEPYFEGLLINLDHCYYFIHLTGTVLISLLYAVATDRYIHLLYTVYVYVIVPSSPSLSLSRLEYFVTAGPWQSFLLFFLLCIVIVCLGFMKRETATKQVIV